MKSILLIAAATIGLSGSPGISGMQMPDQWGNPWLEVDVAQDGKPAIVSVFDCAGKPHVIGEEPAKSVGSGSDFAGFRPYLSATIQDLAAVSFQASWEKRCMQQSKAMQACDPNPSRDDCTVVERPSGRSFGIPLDAYDSYKNMHGNVP